MCMFVLLNRLGRQFKKIMLKMGQPQYAYDFSNLSLMFKMSFITTSEDPTRIHYSADSNKSIKWCSLKYNLAFKSHPNAKVHINYRLLLCKHNRTFEYRIQH